MHTPRRLVLLALAAVLAVTLAPARGPALASDAVASDAVTSGAPASYARVATLPPARHVFVINIENKGFSRTWGARSKAPYLAKTLRSKGVLLRGYYATAHHSQPNYVAQISGQGPNPQMQSDCQAYTAFHRTGPDVSPGQAVGTGCVFPKDVPNLATQLAGHGLTWRGYMQDMDRPCQHPTLGSKDPTMRATAAHNYATRHNPFVYFRAITGRAAYCRSHVVGLGALTDDLRHVSTTRNLTYITPDACHDGHDSPCANGEPGGLRSVNRWMRTWVPRVLSSPAFRRDGVLVITADESDGPSSDSTACCGDAAGPNAALPGINGPGGGHVGALVISPWTAPGTRSTRAYNHYSLLGSIEDVFGLPRLGYARRAGLNRFGLDVYNSGWQG
jgi:hypothetical protein